MSLDPLIADVLDPTVDAIELTRRCLVFARAREAAFDRGRQEHDIVKKSAQLRRAVTRELMSRSLPIDIGPSARTWIAGQLRALAPSPSAPDERLDALLAHSLALALEEPFGARYFELLAAGGPRVVGPDDLVPTPSPFAGASGPMWDDYDGFLPTRPGKLNTRADSLRSRACLRPPMPHATKLRWSPTMSSLDDLEPESTVAVALPGMLDEMTWDEVGDDRFFGVRPKDPQARQAAALELVERADRARAHVVLLPEVCLDPAGLDAVATWVEQSAKALRVAVCGSTHRETDTRRENVAFITSPRDRPEHERIEQRKVRPFGYPVGAPPAGSAERLEREEDILTEGVEIVLVSGRTWSLLALICLDVIDADLTQLALALRPALVLVPAATPKTWDFENVASTLAAQAQAHVLVVNQFAEGRKPRPLDALLARPRENDRFHKGENQVIPGLWYARLTRGGFY